MNKIADSLFKKAAPAKVVNYFGPVDVKHLPDVYGKKEITQIQHPPAAP